MKPVAILLALVLAAGSIYAQQAERPMRRGDMAPRTRHVEMMKKLNLTSEQQTNMRKLRADFQKQQVQNQAKIRVARIDLSQLLASDNPDRSAIVKAIRDISEMQTDMKLARLDHMLAVRSLLTPEQQKIWKENRPVRDGRMRQHMMRPGRDNMGLLGEGPEAPSPEQRDLSPLEDLESLSEPFAGDQE